MKYVLTIFCVGLALGCCGFGGSKKITPQVKPPEVEKETGKDAKPSVDVANFIDKTPSYKGKRLTLTLHVGDIQGTLRDYQGRDAPFFDAGKSRLDLRVAIPHDLDVPTARAMDSLVVTFDCNSGSLEYGNLAVKIERP